MTRDNIDTDGVTYPKEQGRGWTSGGLELLNKVQMQANCVFLFSKKKLPNIIMKLVINDM